MTELEKFVNDIQMYLDLELGYLQRVLDDPWPLANRSEFFARKRELVRVKDYVEKRFLSYSTEKT